MGRMRVFDLWFRLILAFLWMGPVWGYPERIRGELLTSKQGLSQGSVVCILQDGRGFMWFGTRDGLNRYDGYECLIFRHDASDPGTLSSSSVRCMAEDGRGNLWVGTTDRGVNRYDPRFHRFERIRLIADVPLPDMSCTRGVAVDSQGGIWVATDGGLLFGRDPTDNAIRPFRGSQPGRLEGLERSVSAISAGDEGTLWLGTPEGLLIHLNPESEVAATYRMVEQMGEPTRLNRITSLLLGPDSTVYVGTSGRGVFRLDPQADAWMRFDSKPASAVTLTRSTINALSFDSEGYLWCANAAQGMDRVDLQRGTAADLGYLLREMLDLDTQSVSVASLFCDRSGTMWIGTDGYGVAKVSPFMNKFRCIQRASGKSPGLSFRSVRCIHEEQDGSVWVGGYGGLDLIPAEGDVTTIPVDSYLPDRQWVEGIKNDNAYVIIPEPTQPHYYWLGLEGGGVVKMDGIRRRFYHFGRDFLPGCNVSALYRDQNDSLWVGTEQGLHRMNVADEPPVSVSFSPDRATLQPVKGVRVIVSEDQDRLWLGTENSGLVLIDPETGSHWAYRHEYGNPHSLSCDVVHAIHRDRRGRWWIGTGGGGLNEFRPDEATFRNITSRDGLPNNVVNGILEDEQGNLWLSTNRGLCQFNPDTMTHRNFDTRDGLQAEEFNRGAAHLGHSGHMFFGGVNGLNRFYPEAVTPNPVPPPVALTRLSLFSIPVLINQPISGRVHLNQSITETRTLTLSHRDDVISFEFAALDFVNPGQNRFAYMMDGFDRDWNHVGILRHATYTNLPPGTYTFRVKAANSDGVWNQDGVSLKLHVSPPFWGTWAFRLFAGVGLVLGSTGFFVWRFRALRRINRQLNEKVRIRTREIRQKSEELEQKVEELEHSLQHIKRLEGLLPICSHCKKIRNETEPELQGDHEWIQIEKYIAERTDADFSHSLCPDCIEKLYPGLGLADYDDQGPARK